MLQAQPSEIKPPTMRRGHAHKRSAAISGDFDLDFFQRGPSINQTLAGSSSLPTESYLHKTYQSPSPPTTATTTTPQAPALVITTPDEQDYRASRSIVPRNSERSTATTPSPKKKHTRLNSWAHSLMTKPKHKEPVSSTATTSKLEYNSSSNDTTPELNRVSIQSNYSYTQTKPQNYEIPEAIIDLDLASGVHYDPASSVVPTKTKEAFHRRTESAPELEDFFKYKFTTSNKNSRRNSAIYEEEEDDDDEVLSSTSSNANQGLNKNRSVNSLNSASSSTNGVAARIASPNTYQSMTSTPTSTKTRRGASAARYQSYYNNNILLANALKSSESLSQVTGGVPSSSLHKPSYSSFQSTQKSTLATPTSLPHSLSSSSASSLNSSVPNSPSRFKFESKVYDMPAGQYPGYASESTSTPKVKSSSTINTTTSPSKRSVSKSVKSHKKSNSLLSSLTMKIRGGSFSSTKSGSRLDISAEPAGETAVVEDDYDEYVEGDSTLTPFNFGEPGPALDLSTMKPKYYNNDDYDQTTHNKQTLIAQSSPSRADTPKKSKKTGFLHWMKK